MELNTPDGRSGQGQPDPEDDQYKRECHVNWLVVRFKLPLELLEKLGVRNLPENWVGIPYYDQAGEEMFVRQRRKLFGKVHRFHQPDGMALYPYGLWLLREAREATYLIIVQGESDCWVLWRHLFPALGMPGSGGWKNLTLEDVQGIPEIYVVREGAPDGPPFVEAGAKHLRGIGYTGRIFELDMPDKIKDPAELHQAGEGAFDGIMNDRIAWAKEVHPVSQPRLPFTEAAGQAGSELPTEKQKDTKPSELPNADRLVAYALADGLELFADEDETPYARLSASHQYRTVRLSEKAFAHYLAALWHRHEHRALTKASAEASLMELERFACQVEPRRQVHVRRCRSGGNIYIDLGDSTYRCVEITPAGQQTLDHPPVPFRRPRGMLPIPHPLEGGDIAVLWDYANVADQGHRLLLLAWLTYAYQGQPPYPILMLTGLAGSAKSTTAQVLKRLVDPQKAELLNEPRKIQDLFISASSAAMIAFDNLSRLEGWLSDALCRISSGGEHATRRLYTSTEQEVLCAATPIILTSIEDVATRSDLLSRALVLNLPQIGEGCGRTGREFWEPFERDRPYILGCIFDGLVEVLRHLPHVEFDRNCRMLDFSQWGEAVEAAFGWEPGSFREAYARNREEADELALEASLLVPAIEALLEGRADGCWEGTATELLPLLVQAAGADRAGADGWPKQPHHLSGRLRRLATPLASRRITIAFERRGRDRTRIIRLSRPR